MSEPTKSEISQVFKRLRGIGPNKVSGTDCSEARRQYEETMKARLSYV